MICYLSRLFNSFTDMKFFITVIMSTLFTLAFAQENSLRLASDVWPPFTNVEGNKATATELVSEALRRSDIDSRTAIEDFEAVLEGIRKGVFDGSAALWKNEEREEYLLFSDPYLQNQLILVGRKGSDVSARSLADLAGSSVAVVGSYAYGKEVSGNDAIRWINGKSDQENLDRLLAGEADYILVDDLLLLYFVRTEPEKTAQQLEIGYHPLIVRDLHFAIRKDLPGAAEIMAAFNDAIADMMEDGTYNRILQLNWIRTDVDGDGKTELVLEGKQAGTQAPGRSYAVPSGQTPAGTNNENRFYIDGRFYEGWDKVPQSYKVSVKSDLLIDTGSGGLNLGF
jgi:ABC-type amino acid transport substrate-binding protein